VIRGAFINHHRQFNTLHCTHASCAPRVSPTPGSSRTTRTSSSPMKVPLVLAERALPRAPSTGWRQEHGQVPQSHPRVQRQPQISLAVAPDDGRGEAVPAAGQADVAHRPGRAVHRDQHDAWRQGVAQRPPDGRVARREQLLEGSRLPVGNLQDLRALVGRHPALRVVLWYRPPGKGVRKHEVEPLSLLVYCEALYLIGHSRTRQARRIFAVDRITRASRLRGQRFEYPADFDPQDYFDGSFGITLEQGEPDEVELLLDADQAPYVRERTWHPSQQFESAGDGRTRMRMRVRGTFELVQWILGRIRSAEVVRPAGLRRMVRETLAAAMTRHG